VSPVDFYTFFYTAGRYRLVRSDTDRYVECAKAQPSDTRWDRTGPGEKPDIRLITRRSWVQIPPPPPTKTQVRPHFSEWGLLLFGRIFYRVFYRMAVERRRPALVEGGESG